MLELPVEETNMPIPDLTRGLLQRTPAQKGSPSETSTRTNGEQKSKLAMSIWTRCFQNSCRLETLHTRPRGADGSPTALNTRAPESRRFVSGVSQTLKITIQYASGRQSHVRKNHTETKETSARQVIDINKDQGHHASGMRLRAPNDNRATSAKHHHEEL